MDIGQLVEYKCLIVCV